MLCTAFETVFMLLGTGFRFMRVEPIIHKKTTHEARLK